jgi:hypothetical protein
MQAKRAAIFLIPKCSAGFCASTVGCFSSHPAAQKKEAGDPASSYFRI